MENFDPDNDNSFAPIKNDDYSEPLTHPSSAATAASKFKSISNLSHLTENQIAYLECVDEDIFSISYYSQFELNQREVFSISEREATLSMILFFVEQWGDIEEIIHYTTVTQRSRNCFEELAKMMMHFDSFNFFKWFNKSKLDSLDEEVARAFFASRNNTFLSVLSIEYSINGNVNCLDTQIENFVTTNINFPCYNTEVDILFLVFLDKLSYATRLMAKNKQYIDLTQAGNARILPINLIQKVLVAKDVKELNFNEIVMMREVLANTIIRNAYFVFEFYNK